VLKQNKELLQIICIGLETDAAYCGDNPALKLIYMNITIGIVDIESKCNFKTGAGSAKFIEFYRALCRFNLVVDRAQARVMKIKESVPSFKEDVEVFLYYLELIRKRLNLSDGRFEQMAALLSLAWGPTQARESTLPSAQIASSPRLNLLRISS